MRVNRFHLLAALIVALIVGVVGAQTNAARSSTATGVVHDVLSTTSATASNEISANWAGYAVSADATTYTSVTGTWTEPTVTCGASDAGASSAFWVGLGGLSTTSQALEQIGTSADCSNLNQPTYYAWYELVPSASVKVKLKVNAGDTITTSVNVINGTTVEVQVKNRTRKTSFTKKLAFATPDLTSAEWIAEAPSQCTQFRCTPIPLANFSSVSFSRTAAMGNSVGGTITNPSWTTSAIQLVPGGSSGFFPGPNRFASDASSTAGAAPGQVSADGKSFTVTWQPNATAG
jgi:hypothetical protein